MAPPRYSRKPPWHRGRDGHDADWIRDRRHTYTAAAGVLDGVCNERIGMLRDELDPDPGAYVWGQSRRWRASSIRVVPPHRVRKLRPLESTFFSSSVLATQRSLEFTEKHSGCASGGTLVPGPVMVSLHRPTGGAGARTSNKGVGDGNGVEVGIVVDRGPAAKRQRRRGAGRGHSRARCGCRSACDCAHGRGCGSGRDAPATTAIDNARTGRATRRSWESDSGRANQPAAWDK